jgi:hypothetical protein
VIDVMPTFARSVGGAVLAAAGEDDEPPHAGIRSERIAAMMLRSIAYVMGCASEKQETKKRLRFAISVEHLLT